MISSEESMKLGTRLIVGEHKCTVKYMGEVAGKPGIWFGVEWDDPERGKNDGLGLFKTTVTGAGSFMKFNKGANGILMAGKRQVFTGGEFLDAVREK